MEAFYTIYDPTTEKHLGGAGSVMDASWYRTEEQARRYLPRMRPPGEPNPLVVMKHEVSSERLF